MVPEKQKLLELYNKLTPTLAQMNVAKTLLHHMWIDSDKQLPSHASLYWTSFCCLINDAIKQFNEINEAVINEITFKNK